MTELPWAVSLIARDRIYNWQVGILDVQSPRLQFMVNQLSFKLDYLAT